MWKRVVAAGIALAAPLAPAAAQGLNYQFDYREPETVTDDQVTAEEALDRNDNIYGPPPPRRNCKQNPDNSEIVVCAEEEEDQSEFRVQSTAQLDPTGKEATDDGLARAPDVSGDGIFKGEATMKFGSAPPPAIIFDLSELPEAPEGSDADLIAKGKKKAD
jgi:hypothetical protein